MVPDDIEMLVVMESLAQIVYTQNGNQHADVSALLERAKQVSIRARSGAPDENRGVLNHLITESPKPSRTGMGRPYLKGLVPGRGSGG